MSDSLKLRLVYIFIGIIIIILCTVGITVLALLMGFKIIPQEVSFLVLFMVVLIIFDIKALYQIFIDIYNLGKKEK